MNPGAFQIRPQLNWSWIKTEKGVALALISFPSYEETISSRTHVYAHTHNINI